LTAKERKKYWLIENSRITRYKVKYRAKVYKALKADVEHLFARMESSGINSINSFVISQDVSNVLIRIYSEVGASEARRSYNVSRKDFIDWVKLIFDYLGSYFYNKGTLRIVETTKKMILHYYEKYFNGERTMAEIVREIKKDESFTKELKGRAEMIARTEVGKAVHSGRMVGADKSPFVQEKIWISVKDKRSRQGGYSKLKPKPDHWHLDGQVVSLDMKFIDPTNGHKLEHPHDPEGKAEDVINCRCTYATRSKRDENGRLIRKQRLLNSI
jgi:uncharacterized protein with gpF-like domain